MKVWWTPEDLAKFKERTECVAKEYDGFTVAPGQNLNGHLTLGENTADNGGLRIAYQALMETLAKQGPTAEDAKIDGYTPAQRFFITFGQVLSLIHIFGELKPDRPAIVPSRSRCPRRS